mgnify:CR=1
MVTLTKLAESAARRDAFNAIARADRCLEENQWRMAALHYEAAAQKLRELDVIKSKRLEIVQ